MSTLRKVAGRFTETVIDGEVVVMNLDDGVFFSLTGTAAASWQLIDGTRDRAALVDELAAQFAADSQTIVADLGSFLTQLIEAGLVETG
jgi:Coenzyme PQQ synthesis protein D (PqqD)